MYPYPTEHDSSGAGLEGRCASMGLSSSMPLSPTPAAAALASVGSLGPQGAAFAAAAAAAAAAGGQSEGQDHPSEPDLLEYRLGMADVRAKWEVRA